MLTAVGPLRTAALTVMAGAGAGWEDLSGGLGFWQPLRTRLKDNKISNTPTIFFTSSSPLSYIYIWLGVALLQGRFNAVYRLYFILQQKIISDNKTQ
jgi:hypothetical protein